MNDSNIITSLQHEACEAHCEECGTCLGDGVKQTGPDTFIDVPVITYDGATFCADCAPAHNLGQCTCATCDEDRAELRTSQRGNE